MIIYIPVADKTAAIEYADPHLTRQFHQNYILKDKKTPVLCTISIERKKGLSGYALRVKSDRQGIVEIGKHRRHIPFRTVNFFLKAIIQFFALRDNILLLHASSIARDDTGYVFLGPPGAGKTTVLQLAQGLRVLSDDTAVLKREPDGYLIYSSPFDRKKRPEITSFRARLGTLYILRKSSETRSVPVQKKTAVSVLRSCSFLQEYFDMIYINPHLAVPTVSQILLQKAIADLVRTVPVARLFFRKNRDFLDLLI